MTSPEYLREQIEKAIACIEFPACPAWLYEPVRYALGGSGKRLRPTLLLLVHSLYKEGDAEINKAMPAALGLEIYHNHTLLHDDLMDHAAMRRGRPAVHCKWDENTAILSGDAMYIIALRHILPSQCGHAADLAALFTATTLEICEGQQYDGNFEHATDVSLSDYMEMIRLKTAVLLACAAKMGAMTAGASTADADALYAFAENIGLAFQIQDDYLDTYGDPTVFGKRIGGDILCGKKTFLSITATANAATPEQRARLNACLAVSDIDDAEKVAAVTNVYNALDVPIAALTAIDRLYREAQDILGTVNLPMEKRAALWNYVQSLHKRQQ